MKKSQLTHIVIIIVSVIVGSFLASFLHKKQLEIAPSKKLITKTPLGGFHKFTSDVEWMRFIQFCGSQKSIDSKNITEYIKRLETLISLDPNFEKAYSVGVSLMAIQDPDTAVKLLNKACHVDYLKNNWKIPFYAGFILTHHYKDDSRIGEAVKYYEMAVKRAGSPPTYLINALIRTKAKAEYIKNKDKYANIEHATLAMLYREWKSGNSMEIGPNGVATPLEGATAGIPDLTARILKAAQKAKKVSADNQTVLALIEKIKSDVLGSKHLCPNCLAPYSPGEKFCSHCGHKVPVYGVCPKCGAVLRGRFCSHCGFDTATIKKNRKK